MERKITESQVVGYLTPEAQLQRVLLPEPLTNRQEIELLQNRLKSLMSEVKDVKEQLEVRWNIEKGVNKE